MSITDTGDSGLVVACSGVVVGCAGLVLDASAIWANSGANLVGIIPIGCSGSVALVVYSIGDINAYYLIH